MRKIPKQVEWVYHTICDHSPDGVVVFDADGVIIHVNRTAEHLLAYPYGALVGIKFQELLIGEKGESWIARFTLGDPQDLFVSNIYIRKGDGILLRADISFVNIKQRNVHLGTVFIRDISHQHKLSREKEKTERLLTDVFHAIEDGLSILDRDLTIIRTNRWMKKMFQTRMPLVGRKCYEVYRGRTSPCPDCPSILTIKTGKSHHALIPHFSEKTPKGWRDLYAYPVKDEMGKVIGVVEYVRDVTQRVELERKLAENEKRFREFFENIPIFSYITTREGRFTGVNETGAILLGYTKEELLKKRVVDCYVSPGARKRFTEVIEEKGMAREYPMALKKKTGETILCRITATVIRDQQGNITGYQGFIRDVTKEEHLKKELDIFATLLTQTNAIVVVTDANGNIQFVNKAFEEVTGYKIGEVVGKNPRILKGGHHDEAFYKTLWDTITNGKSWHGRFYNKKKDGSLYHEDAYIFPIFGPKGKIANFAAIKRDITREVELEEQAQQTAKLEVIGQLVGGIAHDFNNVLTSIKGFAELGLIKVSGDNPLHNELSRIYSAAEQATRITRQLLGFSRKQAISPHPYSLNHIVRDMEPLLNRYIGEGIELVLDLTKEKDIIMADRGQIEQCILNLVVNARDAIQEIKENQHSRRITIETNRVTIDDTYLETHTGIPKGNYLLLSVLDTGIGMDKEILKKIFDPFFTTKPEGLGTGLGCSTVYGIVKQNKGNVCAYSEPGMGSAIKIYWPATDLALPSEETKAAVPFHSPADPEKKTILVVEDDEGIRDFVAQALEMVGYQVFKAENGQHALDLVQGKGFIPDLLFTDAIMPKMNGREVAEIMVQKFPGIKILFSSGYSESQVFEDVVIKPHFDFIHKPYGLHQLLEKIYLVLEKGQAK